LVSVDLFSSKSKESFGSDISCDLILCLSASEFLYAVENLTNSLRSKLDSYGA